MKRISIAQRGHSTILGALASIFGTKTLDLFDSLGMSDRSLVELGVDAGPPHTSYDHWRRAPFGSSKRTTGSVRRKAKKQRAVARARSQGHA
ncbi:hypothetical protein BD1_43 [Octadecabacter Antarctic BD virus 1]|nr:hypothetical protein BD1_43 [Octadecabacter Antarctic BD virus 1]